MVGVVGGVVGVVVVVVVVVVGGSVSSALLKARSLIWSALVVNESKTVVAAREWSILLTDFRFLVFWSNCSLAGGGKMDSRQFLALIIILKTIMKKRTVQ